VPDTELNIWLRLRDEISSEIKKVETNVSSSVGKMETAFLALAKAALVYLSLKKLKDFLVDVSKAAMAQEDAIFRLSNALKVNNDYTDKAFAGLRYFASEMQRTTIYSEKSTLALMANMRILGIESGQLQQAAKMAIGLADALNMDTETAARYVAMGLQGETMFLSRYIPAMRAAKDKTEELRIFTDWASKAFGTAQKRIEITSGSIAQIKNEATKLKEALGDELLPAIRDVSRALTDFLREHHSEFQKFFHEQAEGIRAIVDGYNALKNVIEAPLKSDVEKEKFLKKGLLDEVPLMKAANQMSRILAERARYQKEIFDKAEEWAATMTFPWADITPAREATDAERKQIELQVKATESLADMDKEIEKQKADLLGLGDMWERLEKVQKYQIELQKVYTEGSEAYLLALQKYREGLADIEALKEQKRQIEELDKSSEKAAYRISSLKEEIAEIKEPLEIALEAALAFKRGFGEAFADVIMGVQNVKDALRSLAQAVLRAALVSVGQNIATNVLQTIGVIKAHGGGVIGETSFPKIQVPAFAFAAAPRLHGYIGPAEVPAILRRGEPVGYPNVSVNIVNRSGVPLAAEAGSRLDMGGMIIDIVVDNAARHGRVYQTMQGIARRG